MVLDGVDHAIDVLTDGDQHDGDAKDNEPGAQPAAIEAPSPGWPEQERQVCVAGQVSKLSAKESETYFRSRPRGSRIGAWASDQSTVVRDRAELESHWKQVEQRFPGEDVPCPAHWGGYVLNPARMEFWQGRPNRLHDRFRYTRQADGTWKIERLCP